MKNFAGRFQIYLDGVREKVRVNMTLYPTLPVPEVRAKFGSRYVKVYKEEKGNDGRVISRSVHSFVDTTNGDVLKAEGWKGPAKHARGNIYNEDNGLTAMSAYGANYFK